MFWLLPLEIPSSLCLIFTATLWGREVKVAQSCPILCNSMGYTVHGILQARILEWVAFPFSRGSSQPRDRTQVSRIAGRFFTSWATREACEVETTAQTVSISYKQLKNLFLISEWESAWSLTLLSQCFLQFLYEILLHFVFLLFFCLQTSWLLTALWFPFSYHVLLLSLSFYFSYVLLTLNGSSLRARNYDISLNPSQFLVVCSLRICHIIYVGGIGLDWTLIQWPSPALIKVWMFSAPTLCIPN